jgi:hypothetical protein
LTRFSDQGILRTDVEVAVRLRPRNPVSVGPTDFLKVTAPSRYCGDCLATMLATSRADVTEALRSAPDVRTGAGRCDNCDDAAHATYTYKTT